MWPQYNDRLVGAIRDLSQQDLALTPAGVEDWPIWATVAHTAGGRVYWLCAVLGEPGFENTPFTSAEEGWEDDPDHPRSAAELVEALETSFTIVESCLDRWTPESLGEEIVREFAGTQQIHTRSSVIQRLLTHEAYHCGQLSELLGIHGLPQIELWAANP